MDEPSAGLDPDMEEAAQADQIIILYILFIRDNFISSFSQMSDVDKIMDVWMISGILGITPVTTTMGAYGTMVDDRARKLGRDFYTAPIGRAALMSGDLLSAASSGMFISFLVLIATEIYILAACCRGNGIKLTTISLS